MVLLHSVTHRTDGFEALAKDVKINFSVVTGLMQRAIKNSFCQIYIYDHQRVRENLMIRCYYE